MIIISQVNNTQKDNFLTIFRFLQKYESSHAIHSQNNHKEVIRKNYADLVVGVNKGKYNLDITTDDFWNFYKIADNFLAFPLHIDILNIFLKLTPYEQNNLLKIVKFIYCFQKENIQNKRNLLHKNYKLYTDLIQKIKLLDIPKN